MKRLSLLVVAMLLATASFAQVKKSPAPERAGWDLKVGLYGDVRAVIVTEYKFEEYFGEFKPIETSKHRYIFDKSGNVVTKQERTRYDDVYSLEYKYDSAGRMISKAQLSGLGENRNLSHKIIYKYDSQGNVVEEVKYSADGKAENRHFHKYDADKNIVEEQTYDADGKLSRQICHNYVYDSMGRIVNRNSESKENFNKWTTHYKYNSTGYIIEEAEYDALDSLWWKNTYRYDLLGNIVRKQCYNAFNALVEENTYEYDADGNNIVVMEYDGKGRLDEKVMIVYDAVGNVTEVTEYKSMYDGNALVPKRSAKLEIFYDNHEEVEFTFKVFDEEELVVEVDDEQVFVKVERMPSFAGGDLNIFRAWFAGEFKYPQEAMENGIQGTVVVKFVVEKDGRLSNVEFLQSPDPVFNHEVLRVLRKSPRWTPGYQGDKPVRVSYVLPIKLNLQ